MVTVTEDDIQDQGAINIAEVINKLPLLQRHQQHERRLQRGQSTAWTCAGSARCAR
ncbi:MAG: hypothetical protein WDN24_12330 [Sphingomonas sp.]